MTGLAELLADCVAFGIRLLPTHDGGLNIDAPQDALTPDLIERLKTSKLILLATLRADCVSPDTRRQVHAEMLERVNAAYQGGAIDWPRIDDIEQQFWAAETMSELMDAVAKYESVASPARGTGLKDQHHP